MPKLANIVFITVLVALSIGAYVYSIKVYASDRSIQCDSNAEPLDIVIIGEPLTPLKKCEVSFRLENMTFNKVLANYEIRNVTYKPANKIQGGAIQYGFFETGSVELKPRESRVIQLNVTSRWGYETLSIKTWANNSSI